MTTPSTVARFHAVGAGHALADDGDLLLVYYAEPPTAASLAGVRRVLKQMKPHVRGGVVLLHLIELERVVLPDAETRREITELGRDGEALTRAVAMIVKGGFVASIARSVVSATRLAIRAQVAFSAFEDVPPALVWLRKTVSPHGIPLADDATILARVDELRKRARA